MSLKKIFVAVFLILLLLVSVWFFYKPLRVVTPELVSTITCHTPNICVDDIQKLQHARFLYTNALKDVEQIIGVFKREPCVVFCSSKECFGGFGFDKASAKTIGIWGIVVGPNGWKDYYLKHEMIHHRQAEELGVLAMIQKPAWFIEGMAYSLSQDPRLHLSEPWQSYRTEFNKWFENRKSEPLWEQVP